MLRLVSLGMERGIIPLFLVSTLVLPFFAGGPNAYLQSLLGLVLVIWVSARHKVWSVDLGQGLIVAAVTLLFVLFTLTNPPGRTDYSYALNFSVLLLILPIAGGLSEGAKPHNAIVVARLALVGVVIALVILAVQNYGLHMRRSAQGAPGASSVQVAMALAILSFMPALGYLQTQGWTRYLYLLGPVLGIAAVAISGSRGALLAMGPMLLILLFAGMRLRTALGIIVVLAVAIVAAYLLFPRYLGRFGSLPHVLWDLMTMQQVPGRSLSKRYAILLGSLQAFQESPWIGHGWGEKLAVVQAHAGGVVNFPNRDKSHLHSDLLDFGVSGGLGGLVAYLLIIFAPIVSAWRSVRDSQYRARVTGVLFLSIGYLVAGVFNLAFGFEFLTTLYVALAAVLLGFCRDEPLAIRGKRA